MRTLIYSGTNGNKFIVQKQEDYYDIPFYSQLRKDLCKLVLNKKRGKRETLKEKLEIHKQLDIAEQHST